MAHWTRLAALLFLLPAGSVTAETITSRCENGLRVTVREDPEAPLVQWELRFAAGSGHDEPGLEGSAHLLEHLLMESSRTRPAGELARSIFLNTVYANAHTGIERLTFETQCLPSQVDSVLAIEVARASGWAVDDGELERERAIVLEELAFRRRGSALDDLHDELIQAELEGHRFGRPIGGTAESVQRVQAEDLVQFGRRWLQLERASLAVVGAVDAKALAARIEATLGRVESHGDRLEVAELPPARGSGAVMDRADRTGLLALRILRTPMTTAEDLARSAFLLSLIEGEGYGASRRVIRGEAFHLMWFSARYFIAPELGFPEADSEFDAQRYLAWSWREIELGVRRLQREARFEKLRNAALQRLSERSAGATGSSEDLGESAFDPESTLRWDLALEVAKAMSAAEVAIWLRDVLNSNAVSVGIVHGRDSARRRDIHVVGAGRETSGIGSEDPLARIPLEALSRAIESYRGVEFGSLEVVERGQAKWVHLQLPHARQFQLASRVAVDRLEMEHPRDKPGVAQVFGSLMGYGYRRSGKAKDAPFHERRLPHEVQVWAGPTSLWFRGSVLPDASAELVTTIDERLHNDSFDIQVWQRLLARGEESDLIRSPVRRYLAGAMLGRDHPYLSEWILPADTNEKLEYDDMEDLHETFREEGCLRVWSVGPQSVDELRTSVDDLLVPFDGNAAPRSETIEFVEHENLPGKIFSRFDQDEVRVQLVVGITPVGTLDEAAISVMEAWVEGELRARLREETGLSYSVNALWWDLGDHRVLQVAAGSAPSHARETFRALLRGMGDLASRAPSRIELELARLRALRRRSHAIHSDDAALFLVVDAEQRGEGLMQRNQDILDLTSDSVAKLAAATLGSGPRAYAVVGPLLEDELDAYRAIAAEAKASGR